MGNKILGMLGDAFENGYTEHDIKSAVLEALAPFFVNKDSLEKYGCESELLSVFEFLVRYSHDSLFETNLLAVLDCYRQALCKKEAETINILLANLEPSAQKENLMWTINYQSESVGNSIDDYDNVLQLFKHMGDNLEIATKHLITELYALFLLPKESVDYQKISSCSFGVVIQNLLDRGQFLELIQTAPPVEIKLSDWRNIAYHHTYRIQDKLISCTYGKKNKTFLITLTQLWEYTHQVMRSSNILNIAKCIFVYDNIELIRKYKNNAPLYFRQPLLIRRFETSILSQGFKLVNWDAKELQTIATINDLECETLTWSDELKKRLIHASQFLYHIWRVTPSELIKIIYQNKHSYPLAECQITGCTFSQKTSIDDYVQNVYFSIYV